MAKGLNGAAKAAEKRETVLIEVPVHSCDSGYATSWVNVSSLTNRQAAAMKAITCSLRKENARFSSRDAATNDGIVVDRSVHAVKWLLDRVADEMGL